MQTKLASLPESKHVALIAHDNKKQELKNWVAKHRDELVDHNLYATGTTGYLIERELGLPIHKFVSGPLGGDQQIGARIPTAEIDILIFFWDPFESMPHDPDIKALLRIAAVWNIPVACNAATADFMITSPHFSAAYERMVPDYDTYLSKRTTS